MAEQAKALRLADELEMWTQGEPAAAELRRQEAVIQQLLGALHSISLASQDSSSTREGMGLYARAAIAAAKGKA
jgi:hypothetical protein